MAVLLIVGFISLIYSPRAANAMTSVIDIAIGFTGFFISISVLFFVSQYIKVRKLLLAYLYTGFSILVSVSIIPFFYKEWGLLWWYFHIVIISGFLIIWIGLIAGKNNDGFDNSLDESGHIYKRIRTKLFLLFLFISLLPTIIFGVVVIENLKISIEKNIFSAPDAELYFLKMQFIFLYLIIFLIVIFSIISFIASGKVVKPIRRLYENANKIVGAEFYTATNVKTGDELEQLGAALNKIASDMRDINKVKDYFEDAKKVDDALLLSIGDGMIATDKDGHIILMNRSAEEILDADASDLMGKEAHRQMKVEDEDGNALLGAMHPLEATLRTKERKTLVCNLISKGGVKLPIALTAAPVILNGEITGAIIIFRDITKDKELDREKTEFVSLASHELRTPASIIGLYSEILLKNIFGEMTEKQRQYVQEIYDADKRLINLINTLLNISRIESDNISIEPKPIKLKEMIDGVLEELLTEFNNKKLNFFKKYDDSVEAIKFDSKFIRIILKNLISNAIKYTPEGGTIKINITRQGSDFIFAISDSGYGIPKDQQSKVFKKLFRADNILGKGINGTGLGLYIVKLIVDRIGGSIWFDSIENKGTTFYVKLPIDSIKSQKGDKSLIETY
ncbi:PAS domain S-box protein [Candidatus Azambacteria bacterium]|nr:PAS domain S-box protein [Candidatus Azambacteria bacterium]